MPNPSTRKKLQRKQYGHKFCTMDDTFIAGVSALMRKERVDKNGRNRRICLGRQHNTSENKGDEYYSEC